MRIRLLCVETRAPILPGRKPSVRGFPLLCSNPQRFQDVVDCWTLCGTLSPAECCHFPQFLGVARGVGKIWFRRPLAPDDPKGCRRLLVLVKRARARQNLGSSQISGPIVIEGSSLHRLSSPSSIYPTFLNNYFLLSGQTTPGDTSEWFQNKWTYKLWLQQSLYHQRTSCVRSLRGKYGHPEKRGYLPKLGSGSQFENESGNRTPFTSPWVRPRLWRY